MCPDAERAKYRPDMLKEPHELLAWLERQGIGVETHWHPAVFTVDAAKVHTHHLPGGTPRTFFSKIGQGDFGSGLVATRNWLG